MSVLAISHPWTYWMSPAIFGLAFVATLATLVGYLIKVVRPKYPPRSARR